MWNITFRNTSCSVNFWFSQGMSKHCLWNHEKTDHSSSLQWMWVDDWQFITHLLNFELVIQLSNPGFWEKKAGFIKLLFSNLKMTNLQLTIIMVVNSELDPYERFSVLFGLFPGTGKRQVKSQVCVKVGFEPENLFFQFFQYWLSRN